MSPEESGHTDFAPQKTIEKRRLAFFSGDHHLSSAQNMPRKTFDPQLTSQLLGERLGLLLPCDLFLAG